MGAFILNDMAPRNIDWMSNYYKIPIQLKSPIDEEANIYANMELDLRNTMRPAIYNGYIDFFFMGELLHEDAHVDNCKWDPEWYPFAEPFGNATTNS